MKEIKAKLEVTFSNGLPMGTRGVFEYNENVWIAYPAKKNQQIFAVTDRLLGIHKAIIKDSLAMINDHPGDADRINAIIERATRALELHAELIDLKTEARTQ